jgi:hypothetical protein
MRNGYKIVIDKPEGKKPLGTVGCRWELNVKENFDWFQQADMMQWWTLVNIVMNL